MVYNENMLKKTNQRKWIVPLISGLLTLLLLLLTFKLAGLLPFGNRTLAAFDANIQYLDFYAYYQDVLAGKNSIFYSFSKTLGGNEVGVFTYYLSSPFCLLLPLFERSQMNLYFNTVVLLKTVLAAVTMGVFLEYRFKEKLYTFRQHCFFTALAVCYAMSQYSISQASNIMWLDSVYFLPLILLAVSRFVQKKHYVMLSVTVGLAILFNWYSAGISCVFAFVWFVYEYFDQKISDQKSILHFIKMFIGFCFFMGVGVALSAIFFLPTIKALRNGSRGALETGSLFDFFFINNGLNMILNYVYGAESVKGRAAVYSGILPFISALSLIASPKVPLGKKILHALMLAFLVLMFCWTPMITVFSLFKPVDTYWYRYAFIGIFILIALAGEYVSFYADDLLSPAACGLVFAAVLIVCAFVFRTQYALGTFLTAAASAFACFLLLGIRDSQDSAGLHNSLIVILVLLTGMDCMCNYQLLAKSYSDDDLSFDTYQEEMSEAIETIKTSDPSYYRISQTAGRIVYDDGKTDSYNEAMAYNYWSISGYTSSPDDNQRALLHRLGYRMNGLNFNVTNECVLPSDSLLGVKYVLSANEIKGLEKVSERTYNGKYIFRNPYSLPMAAVYREGTDPLDEYHTFEFQNNMYSRLYGRQADVYTKLEYTLSQVDENSIRVDLEIPDGNYSVYGIILPRTDQDLSVNINNVRTIAYGEWNTQSVFHIPSEHGNAYVTMSSSQPLSADNYDYEFYALDLDLLGKVTEKISEGAVSDIRMDHGYGEFVIKDAKAGEKLYVSIPFDRGWEITVNGKKAEYDLLSDVLYTIHLEEGNNTVVMKYRTPAFVLGILGTSGGIAVLVFLKLWEKYRKRKQR